MELVTHKHHIIPKHSGGSNEPDNLVDLLVIDHAIAHKVRYHIYGNEYDRLAWLRLSGQIGGDEARLAALRSKQSRQKMKAQRKKALSNPNERQRLAIIGNHKPPSTKDKMFINNGVITKLINKSDAIDEGWIKGLIGHNASTRASCVICKRNISINRLAKHSCKE